MSRYNGSLFDDDVLQEQTIKKQFVEREELYPYIIYIATSAGNCTGILYEAKREEDCQTLCSREDTKGKYFAEEWAYFYTKKTNVEKKANDTYNSFIAGAKKYDRKSDTRFDDILEALNMRKVI